MAADGMRRLLAIALLSFAATASAGPRIEHWTLDNGVRVYFVENRDLPMVTINVAFDAGSARDPRDRRGLSMLATGLLDEGTGSLDANAIAARFEGLGAEVGGGVDRDMASVSLRSLSDRRRLDPAVELFARVLTAPAYPAESLARERSRALLGLKHAAQSPGDVAGKAFFANLYREHPYAAPREGDEPGLRAITRDDLVAFHARYFTGRNAVLAIMGDLTRREAGVLAQRVAGGLPPGAGAPALPAVADVAPTTKAEQFIAHSSAQSHILIGEAGVRRNDPDYFPLLVGNYVLGGGGFVSRLTKAIRDERGLSYSVYSEFVPMREQGPFLIGLQTRNDQRELALRVARDVLTRFVEDGPTAEELTAAKRNLTGGFPMRIDSNGKIAQYLTVIGFYQLPINYIDEFIPRVEAVTLEQIRDAFRRRVHPAHMVTVVVGGEAR
jgi:zinc protease